MRATSQAGRLFIASARYVRVTSLNLMRYSHANQCSCLRRDVEEVMGRNKVP